MTVKFTNNASSSLSSGINSTATSLTVADASTFPSLSGADDYCYLTIQQATATTREVVKATARSGNTFTVQRGVDNTTAASFSSGDTVELRLTSALLQDVIDQATVEGIKTNFQYVPTAGQTQFSGADSSGDTMIINDSELVNVYMNGVRLVQGSDYTVSSANNRITLTSGATTADIIDIEVFGNFTGQSGAAVAITGGAIAGTAITTGSINNTPVGATQANTVAATTLTANSVAVNGNATIRSGNKLIINRADNAIGGEITYGPTGTGFIINDANGDDTIFKTGSTEHMRIDGGTGNVNMASTLTVGGRTDIRGGATPLGVYRTLALAVDTQSEIALGSQDLSNNYVDAARIRGLLKANKTDGELSFYTLNSSSLDQAMVLTKDGQLLHGTDTLPTGVLLGRQLVSSSTTGAEIIAFREDTSVSVGDKTGAFLTGNSDTDGAEDHFVGMYGKVSSTNGSQNLHFVAGRSGYEGDTPDMTLRSGGNLGLGTESPSFTAVSGSTSQKGLHIQNSGNDTSAHLKLTGHNNTGTPGQATDFEIIHRGDALQTIFRHGGANVLTLNSSGFLGVGQSSPSAQLDVVGQGSAANPTLELNSSTSHAFNHSINAFNSNLTAGEYQLIVVGKEGSSKNSGYIGYGWNGAGSNSNILTFGHWAADNLMNLDASGKLGIGRTDPTQLLEVHKNSGGDQTVAKFSAHNYGDTGKTFIEIGTEFGDGSSRIGSFNSTGNRSVIVNELHDGGSGVFKEAFRLAMDSAQRRVVRFRVADVANSDFSIISNDDGSAQAGIHLFGSDQNHSIFFRRGYDGTLNVMDFHQYGTFRFFNDGNLASQTKKAEIRPDGDFHVAWTGSSDTTGYFYAGQDFGATNHRINRAVSQGSPVLVVSAYAGSSADSALFYGVSNGGSNTNSAAIRTGKNTVTSRSINSAGTINASGSDYAEYMEKDSTAFDIAAGDICGVNEDGKLTNKFTEAHSFVVKSTDPSYVGGDIWGSEDVIGKKPELTKQGYVNPEEQAPETDEEYAARKTKYETDLAAFEEALNAERIKYDRIAFSGQVPVNITGAKVGDYIVPKEKTGDLITAEAVTEPTFEQYQIAVGKVWKILEDGRAFISVKIG